MAGGGLLHRVTPDHYNLYDEEERLVGSIHRVGEPGKQERWYGLHSTVENMGVTSLHPNRHEVARFMIGHRDPNVDITDPHLDDTGRFPA